MSKNAPRRYPGKIDQMSAEFQNLVGRLYAEGLSKTAITEELNTALAAAGEEPVSRSSVNRYTLKMEAGGRQIRAANEAATAVAKTIGQIDGGDIDAYLVQLVKTLAIDNIHLWQEVDGDNGPSVKDISNLAMAIRRLTSAQEQVDRRIRLMQEKAAENAIEALKEEVGKGVSQETLDKVRTKVLGIPG